MKLTSPAFQDGAAIPRRFTCEGAGVSPELSWTDTPADTQSLALIVHDPDAPKRNGFTHWIVYNIAPAVNHIAEDTPRNASVPGLGMQGRNDSGTVGYMGPCPPSGRHRYFIRLYALREWLPLPPSATYVEVSAAIKDKIIAEAELMGTYARGSEKAA